MKRLLYILLVCGLFASCKSDDDNTFPLGRVKSIEVVHSGLSAFPETSSSAYHVFDYDNQGRLKKVNDKEFTYGSNDKVASHRIHKQDKITTNASIVEYEYVEQVNYHWDTQGRLKSIVLDSLMEKSRRTILNSDYESIVEGNDGGFSINVIKDAVLATYEYQGASDFPTKIVYSQIADATGINYGKVISPKESVVFHYAGDVVEEKHGNIQLQQFMPGIGGGVYTYRPMRIFSFYRYSNTPHYLYDIYRQMGFNPTNYTQIVPARLDNESYSHIEQGDFEGTVQPDWTKAMKSKIELNERGLTIDEPGNDGLTLTRTVVTFD